jgi:hypothetical protein
MVTVGTLAAIEASSLKIYAVASGRILRFAVRCCGAALCLLVLYLGPPYWSFDYSPGMAGRSLLMSVFSPILLSAALLVQIPVIWIIFWGGLAATLGLMAIEPLLPRVIFLEFDKDGFKSNTLFKVRHFKWADIDGPFLERGQKVSFRARKYSFSASLWRDLGILHQTGGTLHCTLPNSAPPSSYLYKLSASLYGRSARDLAQLLTEWRDRSSIRAA